MNCKSFGLNIIKRKSHLNEIIDIRGIYQNAEPLKTFTRELCFCLKWSLQWQCRRFVSKNKLIAEKKVLENKRLQTPNKIFYNTISIMHETYKNGELVKRETINSISRFCEFFALSAGVANDFVFVTSNQQQLTIENVSVVFPIRNVLKTINSVSFIHNIKILTQQNSTRFY